MSLDSGYREVDGAFSTCRSTMLSTQNELSRIGRVFRNVWIAEVQTGIAKKQAGLAVPEFLNFRGSCRSMPQWMAVGLSGWRVHNLLDSDPPEMPIVDPSLHSADVANLATTWLSGGPQTDDPLSLDVYRMCESMSRLGHDVYLACQRYDYKIKVDVDALPVQSAVDRHTGRTKKQWQDCRAAFEEYWKAYFDQKTVQGYGYTQHVIGF